MGALSGYDKSRRYNRLLWGCQKCAIEMEKEELHVVAALVAFATHSMFMRRTQLSADELAAPLAVAAAVFGPPLKCVASLLVSNTSSGTRS